MDQPHELWKRRPVKKLNTADNKQVSADLHNAIKLNTCNAQPIIGKVRLCSAAMLIIILAPLSEIHYLRTPHTQHGFA